MPKKIVLASTSPRRKEILQMLNLPFEVVAPLDFEEKKASEIADPERLSFENAMGKAHAVAKQHPTELILGVDTVVSIDGEILEKPKDAVEAVEMLKKLRGKTHTVYTCQYLFNPELGNATWNDSISKVEFLNISDEEIEKYVATGEPLDKAGAYAVQGLGAQYIKTIQGDFFGIMGLSVMELRQMLKDIETPTERND